MIIQVYENIYNGFGSIDYSRLGESFAINFIICFAISYRIEATIHFVKLLSTFTYTYAGYEIYVGNILIGIFVYLSLFHSLKILWFISFCCMCIFPFRDVNIRRTN